MRQGSQSSCLAALCVLVSNAVACWPTTTTTRIVDGRAVEGQELPPAAYDAYARGAYFESRGNLEQAREAYLETLDVDGESAEVWTRLGNVLCRLEHADALDAFNEALELDAEYAPAYREAGECLRRRRHAEQALEHATRAVALSPRDLESNLLVTRLLEARGEVATARHWLVALALAERADRAAQESVLRFAVRQKDEALRRWAEAQLVVLDAAHPLPEGSGGEDPLRDALVAGNLAHARSLAAEQGLTPAGLALYAARTQTFPLAIAQARLVLGANPNDSDARIALLAAAVHSGDTVALAEALRVAEAPSRPSAGGVEVLSLTIRWYVSEEAAKEFSEVAQVVMATPLPPRVLPPLPHLLQGASSPPSAPQVAP